MIDNRQETESSDNETLLQGWKEISACLERRAKTVQRLTRSGLDDQQRHDFQPEIVEALPQLDVTDNASH